MTNQEIQEKLNAKRKGTYFKIAFRKVKGDYSRTTTTIVRLVKYANTKKAKERALNNPNKVSKSNPNDKYLGNNLIFNENTQKTRLQVFLTNCQYHKPHSVYEHLGTEITMEEYYQGTNTKPSAPSELMCIDTSEIVMIY